MLELKTKGRKIWKLYIGTTNQEKRNQVQDFLQFNHYDVKLITLKEIGFNEEIDENGETFEENSFIKAKAVKEFCIKNNIEKIVVADDAGLEVEALGRRPGVHTARYAGDHAPQKMVLDKLLDEMKDVPEGKRNASFKCVLTAILLDGSKIVCKGETKGRIAMECGTMGKLTFGPVLIPDGYNKVMNDLTEEEIGHTHRQKAWKELLEKISG